MIGVCGPRGPRLAVARSLTGQLAVLHSPLDLRLQVLGGGPEWSWVGRLPHAGSAGRPVVVLDGAERLRREPQVAGWLAAARQPGGPVLICLDDDPARLPMECTASVHLRGRGAPGTGSRATLHRAGREPLDLALDLPGPAWA